MGEAPGEENDKSSKSVLMKSGITCSKEALEQFVQKIIGRPFKDEHLRDIGTVEEAKLTSDGGVECVIRLHDGSITTVKVL